MDYLSLYEKHLGPGRRSGREVAFYCFRCDKEKRGEPHLYVNPNTGAYCCFVCMYDGDGKGKGNARTFARMMGEPVQDYAPTVSFSAMTAEKPFDQPKATKVYNYLFKNLKLEQDDFDEIIKGRGISDPAKFGVKSCRDAAELLRSYFSIEYLIASGLFFETDSGRLVPHTTIADGRVLIPYMDDKKNVEFIRSRRVKDDGSIKYISPINGEASRRIWGRILPSMKILVVTEGEFKAMSAVDNRIAAVSIPGMNTGQDNLARHIAKSNVKHVVICFDTQVKKMERVAAAANSLGRKILKESGVPTSISWLPLEPGVADGEKMDIDSYLYHHTPEEFKRVLKSTSVPV